MENGLILLDRDRRVSGRLVYIILCLWRNTCSFWIALSPCFLTNFGSEIKLRHGFETHLNRHSDLTGSHERISSIISSGRLRPLGLRCPILSCAQRRQLFTNHNKIGCSLHHRNLCQSIQIAGSLVDLFFFGLVAIWFFGLVADFVCAKENWIIFHLFGSSI